MKTSERIAIVHNSGKELSSDIILGYEPHTKTLILYLKSTINCRN